MLENVPVNSITISSMGGFQDSELQNYALEYILAHIVRMSQKKGEWVTEFTLEEFLDEFHPLPALIQSPEEFEYHIQDLMKRGYLKGNSETHTVKVTKKFAKLCEKYAE